MNARPRRYRCQINLSDKVSFSIIAGFPTLKQDFGGDMVNACCQKRSLMRCQIYIAKGHRAQRPFKLMLSGGEENLCTLQTKMTIISDAKPKQMIL